MGRILVLENDPDFYYIIQKSLEKSGHEVYDNSDSEKCILLNENRRPDLIIVDELDKEIFGCKACMEIKGLDPEDHIPVMPIIEKCFPRFKSIKSCSFKCDGYLPKPFTRNKLIRSVERFFIRKKTQSPIT